MKEGPVDPPLNGNSVPILRLSSHRGLAFFCLSEYPPRCVGKFDIVRPVKPVEHALSYCLFGRTSLSCPTRIAKRKLNPVGCQSCIDSGFRAVLPDEQTLGRVAQSLSADACLRIRMFMSDIQQNRLCPPPVGLERPRTSL